MCKRSTYDGLCDHPLCDGICVFKREERLTNVIQRKYK